MGRRERMVEIAIGIANDDSHGYSQARRWPSQGTDFDCSSLMYYSAHEAGYDVPLSGYTGTMLADFKAAGFTAVPYDGNIWDCTPGDILLAHNSNRQHTEMYVGNGRNVGAHIAETGDIDGAPGDQTGNEISVSQNWGSWDWVLIPPDGEGSSSGGGGSSQPSSGAAVTPSDVPMPEYRVRGKQGGWYDWLRGLAEIDGTSGDDFAGSSGDPIMDIEFRNLGPNGWFVLNVQGVGDLGRNVQNTTGNPVIGVTVYYDTPNPSATGYYRAMYRVHTTAGNWLKWEYDDEDGGAGDDSHAIDLLQLTLSR